VKLIKFQKKAYSPLSRPLARSFHIGVDLEGEAMDLGGGGGME
jgi:hypothetical protein